MRRCKEQQEPGQPDGGWSRPADSQLCRTQTGRETLTCKRAPHQCIRRQGTRSVSRICVNLRSHRRNEAVCVSNHSFSPSLAKTQIWTPTSQSSLATGPALRLLVGKKGLDAQSSPSVRPARPILRSRKRLDRVGGVTLTRNVKMPVNASAILREKPRLATGNHIS
jgi:hypothetical protein